jgi:hypothetical protein
MGRRSSAGNDANRETSPKQRETNAKTAKALIKQKKGIWGYGGDMGIKQRNTATKECNWFFYLQ